VICLDFDDDVEEVECWLWWMFECVEDVPVVAMVRERSCTVEETERVPVVLAGGKRSLVETAHVSDPLERQ
jgi:hypothetical protein